MRRRDGDGRGEILPFLCDKGFIIFPLRMAASWKGELFSLTNYDQIAAIRLILKC